MTSRSAAMCASWFVFPIAKHQQSTSKAPAKHQQCQQSTGHGDGSKGRCIFDYTALLA